MSSQVVRGFAAFGAFALIAVFASSAVAQPAPIPVRVVQMSDGTLYVVRGDTSWTLVPDQISDTDGAALNPSGEIDGTLPNDLFVVQAATPAPVAAPPPATPVVNGQPGWYVGVFRGAATQSNPGGRYTVMATLTGTKPGPAGSVSYPEFPCTGQWILRTATDTVATFTEHIESGGCFDLGTVMLTRNSNGTVDWQWSGEGTVHAGTFATATMTNVTPGR
jgi:hypothetical protein